MSLLEGKSVDDGIEEVKNKFLPTYKVSSMNSSSISNKPKKNSFLFSQFSKAAICIWPAVSTVNFALIPERNRVVFISICSLMWTCFLAYMKQLDRKDDEKPFEFNKI